MNVLLLTFLLPLATGIIVVYYRSMVEKNLKLLLAFSASFLLSVCFIHLLPEVFAVGQHGGYYILAGFFIQILLDFFSEGIEHGHVHGATTTRFPYLIFISLCIHAFIESFPLSEILHNNEHVHTIGPSNATLIGVLLHKIPISIVLTTLLLSRGLSKKGVLVAVALFAMMAPLGMFVVHIAVTELTSISMNYLTAIAIGIFLHISTVILFESNQNHKFNTVKFLAILFGVVTAMVALGSH